MICNVIVCWFIELAGLDEGYYGCLMIRQSCIFSIGTNFFLDQFGFSHYELLLFNLWLVFPLLIQKKN
ncbi:hypothetical protein RchiOBHm_Chr4g0384901 [Rosa chinensis]|uniref:Uncharacterized protein n=1 Tax=Rosa chinensis TaxID=74649 RepID=A0A2P6QNT4_ROSCH|nr:hypothetical protein RchiOBHm_Chr4g0384901 [Rosa chinensis]